MNLDELRRRSAQKNQAKNEGPLQITIVGDIRVTPPVGMLLSRPADVIGFSIEQALDHGYKVLAAAIGCGGKFDQKALEREIVIAKVALEADKKAPKGNRGEH